MNRWFDVHASRTGRPEQRRVALLFNNITERRRSEESLKRAQRDLSEHAEKLEDAVMERTAELREANAELEAFCYSLSHVMRGPLRAIMSFTAFVVRDERDRAGGEAGGFAGASGIRQGIEELLAAVPHERIGAAERAERSALLSRLIGTYCT